MSAVEIVVLSMALGADLFSLAVPIGMNGVRGKHIISSAVVFALFHIGMVLLGYYAGRWLGGIVEHIGAHYVNHRIMTVENVAGIIGALVLIGLGFYMIWEKVSNREDRGEVSIGNPLTGLPLIMLSISVSIDALAAGLGLGMIEVDLFKFNTILGIVIFVIAVIGLSLGRKVGEYAGAKTGLIGAVALIIVGIHILWTLT